MKIFKVLFILFCYLIITDTAPSQNYWTKLNGPYGGNVLEIKRHPGGNLYAIRSDGAYFSFDNGLSWNRMDNGSLNSNLSMEISPSGVLYLGKSTGGIWWSNNNGQSWSFNPINVTPHSGLWASVTLIDISPSGVVYANGYRSFNGGTTFSQFTIAQGIFSYSYAFNSSSHVFAGTNNGVYRSNDNGQTWTNISSDLPQLSFNNIIYENESSILISSRNAGVFKSTNSGASWFQINNGLTDTDIFELYLKEGKYFAGTATGKLFVSDNSGAGWSLVDDMSDAGRINSIYCEGNTIILGTYFKGIAFSSDNGSSWEERNHNLFIPSLNDLAFGTNEIFIASEYGIFYSGNNGNTWARKNNGLPSTGITSVYRSSSGNIFCGVRNSGIYISSDNGDSWNASNNGLDLNGVFNYIKEAGGFLFTLKSGTFTLENAILYRSSDNGSSWQNIFVADGFFLENLTIDSQGKLFIGGLDPSFQPILHIGSGFGNSWTEINYPATQFQFHNLTSAGTDLYMTGAYNVMKSTNSGIDWIPLNGGNWQNSQIGRMNVNSRGDIFAAVAGGIYLSTNDGESWEIRSSGLEGNASPKDLVFDGSGYLYNVTNSNGIFRSLESTLTGIISSQEGVPLEYDLFQNYPNPFNPVTNIKFSVSEPAFVTLKIYDISGKEVATLVNEHMTPGEYTYQFSGDGSGLSSGAYFYRLKAGEFVKTRSMMLIK
jgi:photosystem II stability/assembly factor-like uncharacterized protein